MKVYTVRNEKVKLLKGKNEDEDEPESEENRWRFGSFARPETSLSWGRRPCSGCRPVRYSTVAPFSSTPGSRSAHNWDLVL
jgi:hypothetical protein